jgi:hypothetical protein
MSLYPLIGGRQQIQVGFSKNDPPGRLGLFG